MTKHSVDVLLAVYNNADYLYSQLESLERQTYRNFQIIIRDDGSNDLSLKVIENFKKSSPIQITVIKGTRNLGAAGNFSELMKYATSPYSMFCDGDDIWLPFKIEASLALMKKSETLYGSKTPLLIHTDMAVVKKNLELLSPSFWHYSKLNPLSNTLNRLLIQNTITGCTMLINRPLLEHALPISKIAIMHDWWIGLVACTFGYIAVLNKATMLYRQHGKNEIGAKNWSNWQGYSEAIKKGMTHSGRIELKNRLNKTLNQAEVFADLYGNQLEIKQKKILKDFVALKTSGLIQKRYLFFKNKFFKNTWAHNLGMFFYL